MKTKQSSRKAKKPMTVDKELVRELIHPSTTKEQTSSSKSTTLYNVGWWLRLVGIIGTGFGLMFLTAFLPAGVWGIVVFLYFAPWFLTSVAALIIGHRLVNKHKAR